MALTLDHIRAALAMPPLGERSDFDLNPDIRAAEMPGVGKRPAAVLCGLVERDGGLNVVLTKRAAHLNQHAGQIAFPGGKVDAADPSALAAALREAEEEIGLSPADVEILGTLDQYQTSTGFRVTPFVGVVDPRWRPVPDLNEVEEVFEPPLDFLMDPGNRQRHNYLRWGVERQYYAMPWGAYFIWGATAGMLKGLSDRLAILAEREAS
ncbi:MAG TPA: CoA pyrophosphatase [Thermohalobaculum sp.]|nr:CoA pyrophosphatase [Thermohalobaculum sp.]